jgi:hypothetical protein
MGVGKTAAIETIHERVPGGGKGGRCIISLLLLTGNGRNPGPLL